MKKIIISICCILFMEQTGIAADDRTEKDMIHQATFKVIDLSRFYCNRNYLRPSDVMFETFTSPVTINYSSGGALFVNGGTAQLYMDWTNTGGRFLIGLNGSSSNSLGDAYDLFSGTVGNTKYNFLTNSVIRQTIDGSGNVGIGTTSPSSQLHVVGLAEIKQQRFGGVAANTWYRGNNTVGSPTIVANGNELWQGISLGYDGFSYQQAAYIQMAVDGSPGAGNMPGRVQIFTTPDGSATPVERVRVNNVGYVGIGTTSPSEKLSVNGNISANGFVKTKKLTITQLDWSDYVFDNQYRLRTLSSLETFIKKNKHLPDIPTASYVRANGISVGDTQALLLKKIEELTLYLIQLKKENHVQQRQIEFLMKCNTKRNNTR